MKLIIAIVRPFLLEKLVVALEDIEGFPGITVIESEGFGQRIKTRDDSLNPLKPNKQIQIVAADEMVERIIEIIREHAHTGKKGDGIIFVMPVEQSVLI